MQKIVYFLLVDQEIFGLCPFLCITLYGHNKVWIGGKSDVYASKVNDHISNESIIFLRAWIKQLTILLPKMRLEQKDMSKDFILK